MNKCSLYLRIDSVFVNKRSLQYLCQPSYCEHLFIKYLEIPIFWAPLWWIPFSLRPTLSLRCAWVAKNTKSYWLAVDYHENEGFLTLISGLVKIFGRFEKRNRAHHIWIYLLNRIYIMLTKVYWRKREPIFSGKIGIDVVKSEIRSAKRHKRISPPGFFGYSDLFDVSVLQ